MKKYYLSAIVVSALLILLCGCKGAEGSKTHGILRLVPLHYRCLLAGQKAEAAAFLLENMPYHTSAGRILYVDPRVEAWRAETDSIYTTVVQGHSLTDFPFDSLRIVQKRHKDQMAQDSLPEVECDWTPYADTEAITPRFLIKHINHAFRVWKQAPFAKSLTFEEFKEYILPYRSVESYGFNETGEEYAAWLDRYVRADTASTVRQCVQAYNKAVNGFRDMNGKTLRAGSGGIYDLYTHGKHDCVDVASYGCNILRACGVPAVVEYTVCYRNLSGRHFHCALWNAAADEWETFNPESSLPGDGDWAYAETMNVYRQLYGAQKDTPWFLHADGESVPSVLSNPCFRDVTSRLHRVVSITMPCPYEGPNNLVYLATFNRDNGGLLPVTWGTVDKERRDVTFENAIPDVLYVLVCTEQRHLRALSDPFFATDDAEPRVCSVPCTSYASDTHGDVIASDTMATLVLTRKYPRKPNMVKLSEELVGSRVLGANQRDFSDAVTLLEVREPLPPCFLDYPLEKTGCYRYYRFQTPADHPHANISMLEWVTESRRGYTNVLPATRPHIMQPADTMSLCNEGRYVKLLDEDSWEKMSWKAEYDGNMQTAPGGYPNITLRLKKPQVVTHVRMAPRNADNGIHAGDDYELLCWEGRWKSLGTATAEWEYVAFDNVPSGRMYWLRNLTQGKEEMPFVLNERGRQIFVYEENLVNINN